MRNDPGGERLSWGDTVFLNLERSGMPLNVACVSLFEGDIAFDDYVRFVESRLALIPRYLMRVVPAPLNAGLPSWEYDPEFDLHNHMHEVILKHGSEAELKALAGKTLGKVMDRQRPLWDLTLVRNLKGNRTGLIARMHHCLADGIAGVGIMSALMDTCPTPVPTPKRKTRFRVPPPRDPDEFTGGWTGQFLFRFHGAHSFGRGCPGYGRADAGEWGRFAQRRILAAAA